MVVNFIRLVFIVAFCCFYSIFEAQQDTNFYRIKFTDKANTPFSISNPGAFLSEKAIERRDKHSIPITEQDLPIDPAYISQILSYGSVEYATHSKWFNQLVIISNDTNDINSILQLSFVDTSFQFIPTRPNVISGSAKLSIQSPKESILVNPHYPYGITYTQNHLHQLDFMHDLSFNGQGLDIAVIDAGFSGVDTLEGLRHLFETGQILSTYDFVDLETSVSEDHFHGSAVLSVMGGYIEGEYYGTSTKANYHLLRSEDANAEYIIEEDFWVRAAEYADSAGCDIINTSLGYSTFDDSTTNHTYSDMDGNTTIIAKASDIASSKGVLCVTSAGNLGGSSWGYISTPADADSTLTIGAIDIDNQLATFSSYGPSSDGDLKPNLVSVGWLTQIIAPWDNQIIQANGTSFSAPFISGLAACLWQALPELSNMELKALLEQHSSQTSNPDTLKGFGYPNVFSAYNSKTGITHKSPPSIEIRETFPNPLFENEDLFLKIASNLSQEVELLLINITGQVVYTSKFFVEEGINLVTIKEGEFPAKGVYSIVLQNDDSHHSTRIVLH